jgi:glycosyltransferase involved in cell wall biosynthesis
MKKKYFMFVSPGFLKKTGYFFRATRDCTTLKSLGVDVCLVVFSKKGIFYFNEEKPEKVKFWQFLKDVFKAESIIAQNFGALFLSIFLVWTSSRKVYIKHGSIEDLKVFKYYRFKKILYKFAERVALRRFNTVVCVSEKMKCKIVEENRNIQAKLIVIPNFPDEKFIKNVLSLENTSMEHLRKRHNLPLDKHIICYSGNMQQWQKIDLLIEVISEITIMSEDYFFLILTREKDSFLEIFQKNNINNNYYSLLEVQNENVPEFLIASSLLFVVRDCDEINSVACPTKAIEYLISGTPILVSEKLGDISDIVTLHNLGVVLSEFDIKNKKVVCEKIKNYFARDQKFVNSKIKESFYPEKFESLYLENF